MKDGIRYEWPLLFVSLPRHQSSFSRSSFPDTSPLPHLLNAYLFNMNSGRTTAVKGGSGIESTPANNVGGDRRVCLHLSPPAVLSFSSDVSPQGSSSSGTMFSGLMNQKRNSGDATAAARRQSFNEMKPAPGIIGKMWHKYVQDTIDMRMMA